MKFLFLIAILTFWKPQTDAYRILALFPFPGVSQFYNSKPILDELVNREHHVTVLTVFKTDNPKPNYEEIIVDKTNYWDFRGNESSILKRDNVPFDRRINSLWDASYATHEAAMNSKSFQNFLKNDNSHYDLILTEIFYQEALYMFAHKYKAPIVGLSSVGYGQFIGDFMGNPNILPYMAHEFSKFGKELNFFQRLANIYVTGYDLFWRKFYLLPKHQKLAEKHFKHLPGPLPQLEDIERNISLVLINSHYSYDRVNPLIPGIVEIAGAHIKEPAKLPKNIQTFLDGAKEGAIYFNFGSHIKLKDMPKEKLQIFINVFKKLKQRVIWKWEDDTLTGMPNNIMTSKWLPQNDILAHPNVKLFITHGGQYSIQEAVFHGVPIIGFPIYGDQFKNMKRVEDSGFGLAMIFSTMTEDALNNAVNEILKNPKYTEKVETLSYRFKDRPLSALNTAVYWIEYVIRHKGAHFMKSPIATMSSIEYHMLDSISFVVLVVGAIFLTLWWMVKVLYKFLLSKSHKIVKKQIKKQN